MSKEDLLDIHIVDIKLGLPSTIQSTLKLTDQLKQNQHPLQALMKILKLINYRKN